MCCCRLLVNLAYRLNNYLLLHLIDAVCSPQQSTVLEFLLSCCSAYWRQCWWCIWLRKTQQPNTMRQMGTKAWLRDVGTNRANPTFSALLEVCCPIVSYKLIKPLLPLQACMCRYSLQAQTDCLYHSNDVAFCMSFRHDKIHSLCICLWCSYWWSTTCDQRG